MLQFLILRNVLRRVEYMTSKEYVSDSLSDRDRWGIFEPSLVGVFTCDAFDQLIKGLEQCYTAHSDVDIVLNKHGKSILLQ